MTCARRDIVDRQEVGVYHCISRCVRRAFLCGVDALSGKSFEHRREWIRARLSALVEVFAVEVIAYAAMNNHLHSVLRTRPDIAREWSDEEVARRWRMLFPRRRVGGIPAMPTEEEIAEIVSTPERVALYRERLSCISWFNRCLNENIARRANAEDECKGRFWEGRFKCQRVCDVAGIIACSAYVDLNPIRAGMAQRPEESDHTSIQDRIFEHVGSAPVKHAAWAKIPLVGIEEASEGSLTLEEYIQLVDETGRLMVAGKASISPDLAPVLERLSISGEHWVETAKSLGRRFRRVVGTVEQLRNAAVRAKKSWFHGLSPARLAFVGAARSRG